MNMSPEAKLLYDQHDKDYIAEKMVRALPVIKSSRKLVEQFEKISILLPFRIAMQITILDKRLEEFDETQE